MPTTTEHKHTWALWCKSKQRIQQKKLSGLRRCDDHVLDAAEEITDIESIGDYRRQRASVTLRFTLEVKGTCRE